MTAKPPKLELDGKKWVVEHFKNNPSLAIEETKTNQSVYVYKCEGSTIKVRENNFSHVFGAKRTPYVRDYTYFDIS